MTPPATAVAPPRRTPPGPRGYPVVGILPEIWRDPLRLFQRVALECGDVARMGVGRYTIYLISSPELIHQILHERWRNYWKGDGMAAAQLVVGQGLATSHGALWRRQRRLIQPGFSSKNVAAQLPCVNARTRALLDSWSAAAQSGSPLDLSQEMQHLMLRIVCQTMFGASVTHQQEEVIGAATVVACDHIAHTAWRLLPIPASLPTLRNVRFRRALGQLHGVVDSIVSARRDLAEQPNDMLGRLLSARDEQGQPMPYEQLRDEVMTLFVAGHETPANCLAWTFYLLSLHPEWWRQVEEEVDRVVGARPEPTVEDLARLDVVERVVKESLRLYPPGWTIVRTPIEDDELGGYAIPAGAPLLLSQWVVHRHPKLWTNPEAFDPERWTPERSQGRPRYAWFPFGGGIRSCLGNSLAMMMAKAVVTLVVQRYRMALQAGHRVEPLALTTLRPRDGVRVLLTRRDAVGRSDERRTP